MEKGLPGPPLGVTAKRLDNTQHPAVHVLSLLLILHKLIPSPQTMEHTISPNQKGEDRYCTKCGKTDFGSGCPYAPVPDAPVRDAYQWIGLIGLLAAAFIALYGFKNLVESVMLIPVMLSKIGVDCAKHGTFLSL
jgi:hypothetical protein